MLRICIDGIELAVQAIQYQWYVLVVDFLFLSEVNATYPLMLYFLERGLDFQNDCQFVEMVPQELELSVKVPIFGCLTDVWQGF